MRVVLAHAALAGEGFHGRGAAVGGILVEGHVLVDLHHQRMQEAEHVAIGLRTQLTGKGRHRRIDLGQFGRTQKQARRKALVGAAQHAAGVMGLDQAFDIDGEIADRAMGQHVRDIAERILVHIEPGIGRDVDLPFGDVLPVMAARRHAQNLDHTGSPGFIAIAGGMGNSQAHGGTRMKLGSSCPGIAVCTDCVNLSALPRIHVFPSYSKQVVDGRVKPGHDGEGVKSNTAW